MNIQVDRHCNPDIPHYIEGLDNFRNFPDSYFQFFIKIRFLKIYTDNPWVANK